MNSDDPATTFQVLSHGFGVTPVKVEVQVMSPTTGFIYPGVKSAFAGNDDNERGGIVYLYNDNDIKLYGATNAGTELGTAYIIFTGMTFWTADNQEKSKTGYVRVRAWHPNDLPSPSFTATLNMKAGNVVWNDYEERNHALGILPVLTVVQYSPAFSGTLYGWTAEGQGSSSRPVGNPNLYWGGLIYAVSNEDIRMWAPASGQANYGIFSFCDGWGWDVRGSDCSYIRAAVTIRMWTNLLASEEVNVTDPHDVGEANGTHEINLLPPYTIDVDNDIVTVAAISIGGSNPGFLFYGSGAAMVDNADGCGGVVYAYSNVSSSVRIWHPVDGTSGIIHVYGMGGGTYNQISQQAIIEVRLFKVATTTVAVALPPPPPPPTAAPPTSTTTIAAPPTSTTTIAAPPPTTFAPGMTTTTLPSTTPESVVCFNTTIVVNMTTVLRIANDIVVNLTVPAKTTSKYTRSLTSVRDSRRSSTVIGVVGAGICVGVVCLLVIPDVLTLLLFLIRPRHV